VLDAAGVDRGWAIGHSWGGHLALHLALAHPDRVAGLILIAPLGADPGVFPELDANLRRGLDDAQVARVDEIEQRRRDGVVSEAELVERFGILWPQFFHVRERVGAVPARAGVRASIETNTSIAEHYGRETLLRGVPSLTLRTLFVHGEQDALPPRSTIATADLIEGARVEVIPECGHFPWLERPAEFRAAVERLLEA
jgi:pimeloyl-ACP methyl ester carboxylesterase